MYRSHYSRGSYGGGGKVLAVVVALAALFLVGLMATTYFDKDAVRVEVVSKESIATEGGHEYRVSTDKGTFVMKDSLIYTRFATADDYGKIKVGQTYDCVTYGWRVPLFSMFKNMLSCKPATG